MNIKRDVLLLTLSIPIPCMAYLPTFTLLVQLTQMQAKIQSMAVPSDHLLSKFIPILRLQNRIVYSEQKKLQINI